MSNWEQKMSNLMKRRASNDIKAPSNIGDYKAHLSKCFIGRTLLDVGCGGMALKDLLPESVTYTGIDPFPVNGNVVKADIESFNVGHETVVCFAVLDGVKDIDKALKNIARIAQKNIIILTGIDIEPDECHTFKITENMLNDAFKDFNVAYREQLHPKVILIEYARK